MMPELADAVIIDSGSGMCKAGIAGDDAPRSSFPLIVGRFRYADIMVGMNHKDTYVGQLALAKKGVLKLSYPIEHGYVDNWDDLAKIFHEQSHHLSTHACSPNVLVWLIVSAVKNPKYQRQRMTEMMFQYFDVPAFYLQAQSVLSLYSSGKTTGLTVGIGDGVTQVVPIYQGIAMPLTSQRQSLGGRDLTEYMKKLLIEIGLEYSSSAETQTIRDLKEKKAYVALDYNRELNDHEKGRIKDSQYELPDGQTVSIGSQRFRCAEALFKPYLIDQEIPGIHEIAYQVIKNSDLDFRKQLYSNIVLSGGSTMFPGLPERFSKEMTALAPSTVKVKVYAPQERKFSSWIGGSFLAGCSTLRHMWITKAEYQQTGSHIVHRKCF